MDKVENESDYQSCAETYATFCVYSDELTCEEIELLVGVKASRVVRIGDRASIKRNAFFLSSEGEISSFDSRVHLSYLINKLKGLDVTAMKKQKCEFYITCFWVSSSGNGGPMLDVELMGNLSQLGLDLEFDVYFDSE